MTSEIKTLEDLYSHPTKSYRAVYAAIEELQPVGSTGVRERTGYSVNIVNDRIKFLKNHGLIHIAKWDTVRCTRFALYAVGRKDDAPRPVTQYQEYIKTRNDYVPPSMSDHVKDLQEALVPKRSPEEIHKVNWAYLKYISGESYGYA